MKAHQRIIREQHSWESDPHLEQKRSLASSLSSAIVREISFQQAKGVIEKYEWLGNMGTTRRCFGLFFGEHLAGVTCFGDTGGTNVDASVCGTEHADKVATLVRGACVHWAHPHSASFLIPKACKMMSRYRKHIFIAYSDSDAGEIGTVYQASNWLYCGTTTSTEQFRWPYHDPISIPCPCGCDRPLPPKEAYDGRWRDSRLIHGYSRDRQRPLDGDNRPVRGARCEPYRQHCSRAYLKQQMVDAGFEFTASTRKRRYVGIYGTATLVRELKAALRWPTTPYPKRPLNQPPQQPRGKEMNQ